MQVPADGPTTAGSSKDPSDASYSDGDMPAAAQQQPPVSATQPASLREGSDGADGDDFMVVKRQCVPADDALQAGMAPQQQEVQKQQQPRKRKKMKIKPGKGTGSRVVFDEEGDAREPLAMLGDTRYALIWPDIFIIVCHSLAGSSTATLCRAASTTFCL